MRSSDAEISTTCRTTSCSTALSTHSHRLSMRSQESSGQNMVKSAVKVPSSFDEIRLGGFTEALREGGPDDVVVASVRQESLGDVHGFACVLSRLVIEYSSAPAGAPASL